MKIKAKTPITLYGATPAQVILKTGETAECDAVTASNLETDGRAEIITDGTPAKIPNQK